MFCSEGCTKQWTHSDTLLPVWTELTKERNFKKVDKKVKPTEIDLCKI